MFAALVRMIREWKRYNRSVSELNRLGDRELADIGISRSDIQRVAWSASHEGYALFKTQLRRSRPHCAGGFVFTAGCRRRCPALVCPP
jgi:uncharacterized protein YjiS (DUF1127 family)